MPDAPKTNIDVVNAKVLTDLYNMHFSHKKETV